VFRELRIQEGIRLFRDLAKAIEINRRVKLNILLLLFTRKAFEEVAAAFVEVGNTADFNNILFTRNYEHIEIKQFKGTHPFSLE